MQQRDRNGLAYFCTLILILSGLAVAFSKLSGCGSGPQQKTEPAPGGDDGGDGGEPSPPPPPVACDAGMKIGDTKEVSCPTGQVGKRIYVCNDRGLTLGIDTCKPAPDCQSTKTDFTKVKPIITNKCVSCHVGFDTFATAKVKIDESLRRIALTPENPQYMPKSGGSGGALTPDEKLQLKKWRTDGLLETDPDCGGNGTPQASFIKLDDIETAIIEDLNGIDVEDRTFIRYFVTTHRVDEGADAPALKQAMDAGNKSLNSVSNEDSEVYAATPLPSQPSVFRFDLRSYGMSFADWLLVEDGDTLKLTSDTTKGRLIKLLSGTQRPWMHVENMNLVMHNNSTVYYRLVNAPGTLQTLLAQQGVQFAADLKNGQASLLGLHTSPITEEKNRLVGRWRGRFQGKEIAFWNTFDTLAINGKQERNLFQFPLLKDAGTKKNFAFDAGESIWEFPNGFHGYFLSDGNGKRLDFADPNVVRDTRSPVSSTIRDSLSCFGCHNEGLIQATDNLRVTLSGNDPGLDAKDLSVAKDLYKDAASNNANINADKRRYAAAMAKLGISTNDKDPVTETTDRFQLSWSSAKVASLFFRSSDELRECIDGSASLKAQVPQLLNDGGTIVFEQLQQTIKQIADECEFLED